MMMVLSPFTFAHLLHKGQECGVVWFMWCGLSDKCTAWPGLHWSLGEREIKKINIEKWLRMSLNSRKHSPHVLHYSPNNTVMFTCINCTKKQYLVHFFENRHRIMKKSISSPSWGMFYFISDFIILRLLLRNILPLPAVVIVLVRLIWAWQKIALLWKWRWRLKSTEG